MGNNNFEKKTWREFQANGLLWFINSILHVFGWAIVVIVNDFNNITDVYPARTKCRGFPMETNIRHYKDLTEYMVANANKLLNDFEDNNETKK